MEYVRCKRYAQITQITHSKYKRKDDDNREKERERERENERDRVLYHQT